MSRTLILGSGIALGVYVPALSVKKQLEQAGHSADLLCLEELYIGKEAVIEATRRSFHADFRLARTSYRLPSRNSAAIDPAAKEQLLTRLAEERYEQIIPFSGFWMEFLQELIKVCPYYAGRITAVHMDAVISNSWKRADRSGIEEIWLYRLEDHSIQCLLEPAVRTQEQQRRILVHGGGWGIGDYSKKIRELNELGYALDVILYDPQEAEGTDLRNEYYLLDPAWRPGAGDDAYPPLFHLQDGSWTAVACDRKKVNPIRLLIEQDIAILSKPGGGTLSDSLVTGTPLLFSEELAGYERDNRQLWIEAGFGMAFEDFIEHLDRDCALQEMQEHLKLQAAKLPTVMERLNKKETNTL